MNCYTVVAIIVMLFQVAHLSAQEVYETEVGVVGMTAEIPCNATTNLSEDRLMLLSWYKQGIEETLYSRDFRPYNERPRGGPDKLSRDNRYSMVGSKTESRLLIENLNLSDAGLYHCIANFALSPNNKNKVYTSLQVIEPPERIWIVHENGTKVVTTTTNTATQRIIGPYYLGNIVHLFCVAFGGKPQPELSWWENDENLIKVTSTPLSELRVRSDLEYGPLRRDNHGVVLTCRAQNNNVSEPLSLDISLDIFLPAQLVTVQSAVDPGAGVLRVKAKDELRLECHVLGASPPPNIIWVINGNPIFNLEQNISMQTSRDRVVSEVKLTLLSEHDEAHISCCVDAYSGIENDTICAEPLPLSVYYPPVLELTVNGEVENGTLNVIKGSNIYFNCTIAANPSIYDLTWYHGEEILTDGTAQPTWPISFASESDAGEYVCAGSNTEGATTSDPIILNIIYPPFCNDETVNEFGLAENESMNLTCDLTANPEPMSYRWMLVAGAVNLSTITEDLPCTMLNSTERILTYTRPNHTSYGTVFCWGINGVEDEKKKPCTFLITDETVPRPPSECVAKRTTLKDITVNCIKGHSGGMPQKFVLFVKSLNTDSEMISIISLEPHFIIQEPEQEAYKIVLVAVNDKGKSEIVTIAQEDIVDESEAAAERPARPASSVSNIATLALSLCGGVALVALAACGLVLCAHERSPLTAYNIQESNCGTFNESDEGSECNMRRTDSFRRAMAPKLYPQPRGYDVHRTSSFHSARYLDEHDGFNKYPGDVLRHNPNCRVHSLQNINKRRDLEPMCDHILTHVPSDMHTYNVPRPATTFYTMPRKSRQKITKDHDEIADLVHNSDGFSLPPPPDEFTSYRPGQRLSSKETLKQTRQKNNTEEDKNPFNDDIISPMNTVGLPTVTGHGAMYTYPDDDAQNVTTRANVTLSTFQHTYSSPKESGF